MTNIYEKLIEDEKNKEFKLYITIDQLKEQLKRELEIKKKKDNIKYYRYYIPVMEHICKNLNSEEELREYLNKNYYNHTYTYIELEKMDYDVRRKIIEEDAACRALYQKQKDYYNEEIRVVKLKCKECGNIQGTYPASDSERRMKDSICSKCGSSIYVDIDTKLDNNQNIICCNDELSKISMFTDSFKNCYATHVYKCSKCNKEDTVYMFRDKSSLLDLK